VLSFDGNFSALREKILVKEITERKGGKRKLNTVLKFHPNKG